MIICKADMVVVFEEKKKRTSIKGVFGPRKDMNKAANVVQ
jgi:hypothetical protein